MARTLPPGGTRETLPNRNAVADSHHAVFTSSGSPRRRQKYLCHSPHARYIEATSSSATFSTPEARLVPGSLQRNHRRDNVVLDGQSNVGQPWLIPPRIRHRDRTRAPDAPPEPSVSTRDSNLIQRTIEHAFTPRPLLTTGRGLFHAPYVTLTTSRSPPDSPHTAPTGLPSSRPEAASSARQPLTRRLEFGVNQHLRP